MARWKQLRMILPTKHPLCTGCIWCTKGKIPSFTNNERTLLRQVPGSVKYLSIP